MGSMSLEDTAEKPMDSFELGDKLCVVSPGNVRDVTPFLHIGNRMKMSQGFYVQVIAPDALRKPPEPQHMVIWLVPISRSKELVPE